MINPFSFKVCPFVERVLDDMCNSRYTSAREDRVYRYDDAKGNMNWWLTQDLMYGVSLYREQDKVPLTFYEEYLLTKEFKKHLKPKIILTKSDRELRE